MSTLVTINQLMTRLGWSYTDGAMLKRDRSGIVVAHQGDAEWEADLDWACATASQIERITQAP